MPRHVEFSTRFNVSSFVVAREIEQQSDIDVAVASQGRR